MKILLMVPMKINKNVQQLILLQAIVLYVDKIDIGKIIFGLITTRTQKTYENLK